MKMQQLQSDKAVQPRLTWDWIRLPILVWEHPLLGALLACLCYTALTLSDDSFWRSSEFPYYNWLADAFLHGRLDVPNPPNQHDLSVYNGRYYLYWGPMPAILLIPLVALFGPDISDVRLTLILGGLNVALVAWLLRQADRRGVITVSRLHRGLLVLFFALGTVHMTLAPFGRVWFTGQLVGFGCVGLAYLAALSLRGRWAFAVTGIALACAMLTRNHLVLAGLWPAYYLWSSHVSKSWQERTRLILVGVLPLLIALLGMGVYNWLRFDHPLDNGLAYHNMAEEFRADYNRYGAFNIHYLPKNLYYQYVFYPFPERGQSGQGGSLFLLSPVFFAALSGLFIRRHRQSALTLLATIVLVAVPILLLMGTGWVQIGPRYTLDFTVPLLLLTAIGIARWPTELLVLFTTISVSHYVYGAIDLGHFFR